MGFWQLFNSIRRGLYFTQRTMGDVNAARRGPEVLGERLVRRQIFRAFFRGLR